MKTNEYFINEFEMNVDRTSLGRGMKSWIS